MKECHRCKKEKEQDQFWSGCAYCIECDKEYRKEWRQKNKEKYAERRKFLWRQKHNRICKNCSLEFVGKGLKRDFCSTKCKLINNIERVNGCWEWKGDIHPNGYAYTTIYENNKKMHAHRASYIIFNCKRKYAGRKEKR